jgi:hypothetical protein
MQTILPSLPPRLQIWLFPGDNRRPLLVCVIRIEYADIGCDSLARLLSLGDLAIRRPRNATEGVPYSTFPDL